MNQLNVLFFYIFSLILVHQFVVGTEFTFDLVDNAEECFSEHIEAGVACTLEYSVVSGGKLDVDVAIEGPNQQQIYRQFRKEFDKFRFNTTEAGEHSICFSNQFSTFTDKSVYLSFEAGKTNLPWKNDAEHDADEAVEIITDTIHYNLDKVVNGQTHYRLAEAHGRRFAIELNDRVMWWSMAQTFVVIAIGVSQVLILRNFFNDPKPEKPTLILGYPSQPNFYG